MYEIEYKAYYQPIGKETTHPYPSIYAVSYRRNDGDIIRTLVIIQELAAIIFNKHLYNAEGHHYHAANLSVFRRDSIFDRLFFPNISSEALTDVSSTISDYSNITKEEILATIKLLESNPVSTS